MIGVDETPPPFVPGGLLAAGDGLSEVEAGQVQRLEIHHCLQPVQFLFGQLDVSTVGVDCCLDAGTVPPTRPSFPGIAGVLSRVAATRAIPAGYER
ncbi:MAG: hypothetical protein GY926_09240 [bacterium]|nr:hypothetical protein [Actinomycetes bacterium]MCP4965406.1 hypothetical protein [bacterium]